MFYTIYKITNNLNHKIYIGAHKCKRANDNYYGSGTAIKQAIKHYGKTNFAKEVLFVFSEEYLMWEKETELVNLKFISRIDTYNQCLGGKQSGKQFRPGYVCCRDQNDNYIEVSVTDPKYISGEYRQIGNKSGYIRLIHKNSGESKDFPVGLIGEMRIVGWEVWSKGFSRYKDDYGNNFYLKSDDTKIKQLNLVPWSKNKAVMFVDGVVSWIDTDKITSDMIAIAKDYVSVKDASGNTFRVHKTDPRYISGEIVGVNKGKSGLFNHLNTTMYTCEHCGKTLTKGNYVRWHGARCKLL